MQRVFQTEVATTAKKKLKMLPSDEVLVKWYHARDVFTGMNYTKQDMAVGLALAREVKDAVPEAAWLCSVFPGEENVFLGKHPSRQQEIANSAFKPLAAANGTTTEYFYAYNREDNLVPWDEQAHFSGHPVQVGNVLVDQAEQFSGTGRRLVLTEDEITRYRLLAAGLAVQREPRGLYALGIFNGDLQLIKQAAEFGFAIAQSAYGMNGFAMDDPQRYLWMGTAAQKGCKKYIYLENVSQAFSGFLRGNISSACIAQIDAMYGVGELEVHRVASMGGSNNGRFNILLSIQKLCAAWRSNARDAVNAWLLVGRRLKIVKDIRGVIGKRIWSEWLHDVEYIYPGYGKPFEDHVQGRVVEPVRCLITRCANT
jgi:hypothetical protein